MLFKDYHIPMIRSGSKTATRREWSENYAGPNVGSVVAATTKLFVPDDEADCYIRITGRYRQPLGQMTGEDAQAEGDYRDLDDFKEAYEDVYGEGSYDPHKVVDVVEFEYVGHSRPGEEPGYREADEEQQRLIPDGGQDGVAVKRCPFEGCSWQCEFDPDDEYSEWSAQHDSEMHYEREHAGKIRVLVAIEADQLLGNRDPEDVRKQQLERFQDKGHDVAWVRSEVIEEADDHSRIQRAVPQERSSQ